MQITFTTYAVRRDASTIVYVCVPSYEAKVLKTIFGTEFVQEQKDAKPIVGEREASEETQRLIAKYGENSVVRTFGANADDGVLAAMSSALNAKKAVKKTSAEAV